jgi:hypothetical protein
MQGAASEIVWRNQYRAMGLTAADFVFYCQLPLPQFLVI